jgi:hypothetical protein
VFLEIHWFNLNAQSGGDKGYNFDEKTDKKSRDKTKWLSFFLMLLAT